MKKLILGKIPDNFHPDIHIPISPSCFIGKEHVYPEFESLDFYCSVESIEELAAFDKLSSDEALYLVSLVAKKYNKKDFNNYSFRFWKTLYYPFLGLLVPWIYRKQILIKKITEQYANEEIEVSLINNVISLEFKDEYQFITDGLWNSALNEWLFSMILKEQVPLKWKIEYKTIKYFSESTITSPFDKKRKLKSILYRFFKKIFYRSIGIYGFNLWQSIYFHLLLKFKPKVKFDKQVQISQMDSLINWEIDIEEIIDILMPVNLKQINTKEILKNGKENGKLINYSNKLYYDFEAKLDAANAFENNNIVITTQHGGHNYGSSLTFEYGKNIEYNTDYFISWGDFRLDGNNKNNIISIPSPFLSKYLDTHKRKNAKVILVGTYMNCFLSRFDSTPNEMGWLKYRKNKATFIKNLKIRELWYRPYLHTPSSLLDWEYVSGNSKSIIKLEGKLHAELQKCKLLILDHPGTTWNIAMAMNTPIICFWKREHFPFNKEANAFLNRFQSLGLYFDTSDKAAKKVNSIIKDNVDLSQWWNQNEIQKLRMEWMKTYAKSDKNWFWTWNKALWKLNSY